MKKTKLNLIKFEEDTKYGVFNDAIIVDQQITDQEIDILIQERVDKWVLDQDNPPVKQDPTKAQREEKVVGLNNQINDLIIERDEEQDKIDDLP